MTSVPASLRDAIIYTADGEKIGRVVQLFCPAPGAKPAWATVATGLLGSREVCVPVEGAHADDAGLRLPFSRAQIAGAPALSSQHELTAEDEDRLRAHFGIDHNPNDAAAR